mmetsp:Transcript_9110/g.17375  ORF Transcript_9110/g.17375 Transcript_9110/m.17375 type:complete len:568 (-) Transcript_9110:227-1930(-)
MSQSHEDKAVEHPIPADTTVLGDNGITTPPDVEQGLRNENEEDHHPLAVAVPVSKDEVDRPRINENIPKAESYDPSSRGGRQRRWMWMMGYAVLLLCAVGIPVGIVMSQSSSESSNNGSDDNKNNEPLHPRETLGIRQQIEQLVGPEKLLQSPYQKALQWITFDDSLELTPDNENLEQRYMLAYVYYATTESGPWKSCNPPAEGAEAVPFDYAACTWSSLISVDNEIKGKFVPKLAVRWLSNRQECTWAQVKCNDDNQIIALELDGQDLNGIFPEGIVHLPFLEKLSLSLNKIRGSIPRDIARLANLKFLDISFNSIEGVVPEELWGMFQLNTLYLHKNELGGNLPTQVGQLVNLVTLSLSDNPLTGEIPSDIGKLRNLTDLRLASSGLRGRIPMELGQLSNLIYLRLNDNDLSGRIPSEIGVFQRLAGLFLSNNPLLRDDFPAEIWSGTQIRVIDIRGCDFTGSIGSRVGEMSLLRDLWLSGNPFTGTIPTELANLADLRSLLIENTNIEGPMPVEVCKKPGWSSVDAWADCLGDQPEFECSCCTTCCLSDGTGCEVVGEYKTPYN